MGLLHCAGDHPDRAATKTSVSHHTVQLRWGTSFSASSLVDIYNLIHRLYKIINLNISLLEAY